MLDWLDWKVRAGFGAVALCSTLAGAQGAPKRGAYPHMAPLAEYLMPRDSEIALARSAAPESIAGGAGVLVLTAHGYEKAVSGTNGFVCLVERGWTADAADPVFWNPKIRGPMCLNAAAVTSHLPITVERTRLALAGKSNTEIAQAIAAAVDAKRLPRPSVDAMCYMMSKQGYLSDDAGPWHPHIMWYAPETDARVWGANAEGSPILASKVEADRVAVIMIPVRRWSDGTEDLPAGR